jgi:Pyruvate/2-oxoacid:ferredoxin oxidoreductase delta subunit
MVNRLLLFYFTGTGNALAATHWIAQMAEEYNIPVEMKKMTPSLSVDSSEIPENTLIGFCYPTHGFNAPPVVIDFMLRFPHLNNKVFLLNTRAGMKLYQWFTPGMSGLAQLLPAAILKIKGCTIIGWQPMDLPSNWISIHPGLRQKVVDSIFQRCEMITKRFAKKILSGRTVRKGLISLPIDLIISPISVGYYFFGRFALAKTFVADSHCTGCKRCEKECPVQAILMKNGRPFWTRKCESCMHCMNRCPGKAIQTPHLFVVLIWWLVFSVIPVYLVHIFASPGNFLSTHFTLFVWIFVLITGLPIIFFSYQILHFLMRYRFFNWLITSTSLTKFKFWRRYFAPENYL